MIPANPLDRYRGEDIGAFLLRLTPEEFGCGLIEQRRKTRGRDQSEAGGVDEPLRPSDMSGVGTRVNIGAGPATGEFSNGSSCGCNAFNR